MSNITFNKKHWKHINEVILSSCIQQWSFIDWCSLGRFSFIYNYMYCKKVDFTTVEHFSEWFFFDSEVFLNLLHGELF